MKNKLIEFFILKLDLNLKAFGASIMEASGIKIYFCCFDAVSSFIEFLLKLKSFSIYKDWRFKIWLLRKMFESKLSL